MLGFLHTFLLLIVLIALNEVFRRYRKITLGFFILLPLVLTFTVWVKNATGDASTNTWFHWAKVYSVVAAAIGYTLMRLTKLDEKIAMKLFVPAILVLNILEAVARDFQFFGSSGDMWHVFNGLAGIFNLLAISGWMTIASEKADKHDLLWPDMTTFYIVAYSIWNLTYVWLCIPIHSGYAVVHLLAAFIPAIFIKKGTWIQARAYTLGVWMIYLFTFTSFVDNPAHLIELPNVPALKWIFAVLSLGINASFFGYHLYRKITLKRWKPGVEVHAS